MTAGKGIEPAYAAAMPAPQGGALPTTLEWNALHQMAETLAGSDLIPYRLKRKPGDVAVILLAAREYGIPPLMALSKLPVVNGTPAPMGELMVALILRAGHYIAADFRNPDGSVYKGGDVTPQHYGEARYKRSEWPERETMTFTLDEALTAGLIDRIVDGKAIARVTKTKNGNQVEEVTPWEQYTPNMARWRAVANAARLAFADILMGLSYLPEELGATVDADGAPIVVDGEVVQQQPRRTAPDNSLAQRTAQECADRLVEYVGPPEFLLDKILGHAEDNGYDGELVKLDVLWLTDEEPLPLRDAIHARAEWLEANTVDPATTPPAEDVPVAPETSEDAPIVEDPPADQGTMPDENGPVEEPQGAPEAAAAPETTTTSAPTETGPQNGAQLTGPQRAQREAGAKLEAERQARIAARDDADDAIDPLEFARAALEESDGEAIRTMYRMAGAEGRAVNVISVIGDDDLAAINMQNTVQMPLGALLVAAGKYVEKHGVAIRDLGV